MAKDAPFWSDAPMGCCHGYGVIAGNEDVFSVDTSAITFGAGALAEAGASVAGLGCKRVALFTDRTLAALEPVARVRASLVAAGLDVVFYDEVRVEPTDASFLAAAAFATEGRFDGYVSVGGGSVMDTCKAALLYATYPAPLEAYVNAPLGEGRAVPGPLPPHVACPTTCGTGSECTGIAVFDWLARKAKTGIASRRLRPTLALVDPTVTATLPAAVVAASGFDVLCHAIESYTARPYTARAKPGSPALRPMSQGRNPWSDVGALEALTLGGRFLVRAVRDASDVEARSELAWAATLAGIAFGNSGVHVPHAMSYAVSGLVRDFRMPGYPDEPLVPHGVSVVVNAPAVVRFTASSSPERHLTAAAALGADVDGAGPGEVGDLLAEALAKLMRDADVPNGLRAVGYSDSDLDALVAGTTGQKRLLDNAPRTVTEDDLRGLFTRSMRCW